MTRRFKIPEAKTAKEAAGLMSAGFLWFLVRQPIKTVLVLAFLMSGPAYISWDWATSYRVQVKKASPAKAINEDEEMGSLFSPSTVAYAGEAPRKCRDSIKIHDVFYGCKDATLSAFAVLGTDRWIIHDHETEQVYDVEFSFFRDEKQDYKQRKK